MSVEYIPFDPTLIGKEEIIIWCPQNEDYDSLAELLEADGVMWAGGKRPTGMRLWGKRSDARHIDRYKTMKRADIALYETTLPYANYVFMKWPPEQEVTADVGDLI